MRAATKPRAPLSSTLVRRGLTLAALLGLAAGAPALGPGVVPEEDLEPDVLAAAGLDAQVLANFAPGEVAFGVVDSPGGAYPPGLFLAGVDASGAEPVGVLWRLDDAGALARFVEGSFSFAAPVVGPPGAAGFAGELFVLGGTPGSTLLDAIYSVDPLGDASLFAALPAGQSFRDLAFDAAGCFGDGLFATVTGVGVVQYTAGGVSAPVVDDPRLDGPLGFGPGGDWGGELYVCDDGTSSEGLFRVEPGGTVERIAELELPLDFDWGFGAEFTGDMFVATLSGLLRVTREGDTALLPGFTTPFAVHWRHPALVASSFGDDGGLIQLRAAWVPFGEPLAGTHGEPQLAIRSTMVAGDLLEVDVTQARPSATAGMVVGVHQWNLPFKGGVMIPELIPPGFLKLQATDAQGELHLDIPLPDLSAAGGTPIIVQYWIVDPVGVAGYASTGAVWSPAAPPID